MTACFSELPRRIEAKQYQDDAVLRFGHSSVLNFTEGVGLRPIRYPVESFLIVSEVRDFYLGTAKHILHSSKTRHCVFPNNDG